MDIEKLRACLPPELPFAYQYVSVYVDTIYACMYVDVCMWTTYIIYACMYVDELRAYHRDHETALPFKYHRFLSM